MNRDAILIGAGCLLAIIAGGWLFFTATSNGPSAEKPKAVPFSVIEKGISSGAVTERKNYHVQSVEDFTELWFMVYGTDAPALPPVDFTTDEVLAVFDGVRPSGGFAVSIAEVKDTGLTRSVRILHQQPGENCLSTQALTSPFEIVVLPKSDATIAREDVTETVSCE